VRSAAGAIALLSARGLDAAVRPFVAVGAATTDVTRLTWSGPTRTEAQRREARALASGRPPADEKPARTRRAPTRRTTTKGGGRR